MEYSQVLLAECRICENSSASRAMMPRSLQAYLVFGLREEAQNARVVVDGFVEAVVIRLHHIVHQVFNSFPLSSQL